MNTYSNGFYSLMQEAGILSKKSFDTYIKNVVGFGNSQDLKLDGFVFEPAMQLDFDYEQLQVETKLKVMATYTDKDSEAIPFGTKGFTTSRGSIPRQKARFLMDEDDYRKYLIAVQQLGFSDMTAREYALDLLFNKMEDIKSAHETSMTYQRDQMISNGGVTLSAENNPRGLKGIRFDASIPADNIKQLTGQARWFTDTDKKIAGTSSNPVNDVKSIVRAMKREGFLDITCEVDEVSFLDDMMHPKWQEAIGFALSNTLIYANEYVQQAMNVAANATDDQIKAAFARIIGCTVKYSQSLVATEVLKSDKSGLERKAMRSFNANTYVFYPSGNLGTIKVVAPLMPDSSALYGSVLGGKGIIKYEYDPKSMTQDWWSELTALCVPNRSNDMYYLKTY